MHHGLLMEGVKTGGLGEVVLEAVTLERMRPSIGVVVLQTIMEGTLAVDMEFLEVTVGDMVLV